MTDEKKPVVLGPGRLYFTGGLAKPRDLGILIPHVPALDVDDEISLMKVREPTFRVEVKVTDRVSAQMQKAMGSVNHMIYASYFGRRIADLLTSADPRQRKRGRRLREQMLARQMTLRFTREQAEAYLADYRREFPDLRRFYNTQLGETYDPERYRKD
jgi:hypothetical protein